MIYQKFRTALAMDRIVKMNSTICLRAGAHTIGVTHCDKFIRRIYTFKQHLPWNPPMNLEFLRSLRRVCPINYSPTAIAMLDVSTPRVFDNAYFNNLRYNKGLLYIVFSEKCMLTKEK